MSVSIDFQTKIINVPKAYMTLIQATPTEIRELNIETFRYTLRAIEAGEEGMIWDYTHDHNAPVDVGGVTLARVVKIINGYTVTFEDGQYAVNITGGNSNIGDNVNVNQVSVRSANSAGLISNAQIEFSSFNGGVTIDVINGFAGTTFPIGTEQQPVSNLADAKLIAAVRGFDKLYIKGYITFTATDNIDEYQIFGQNARKTLVTLEAGASTDGTSFFDCTITGVLDGDTWINHCLVDTLAYIQGQIENSVLLDVITLAGTESVRFINCADGVPGINTFPVIDMGGSGRDVIITDYDGTIVIRNLTGPDIVEISIGRGHIHIMDTVTDGTFILHGIGTLDDESTGTTILNDGLINRQLIYETTRDRVFVNTINGTAGTDFPIGTPQFPVDNMVDAKIISDIKNTGRFHITGSVTLNEDFSGYVFHSDIPDKGTVDLNGQNITGALFDNMTITGSGVGHFDATNSVLNNGYTNIQGHFDNCQLTGTFIVAAGERLQMDKCTSNSTTGVIINVNGTGNVGMNAWSGIVTITNATDPSCLVALTGNYICTLHSSCTAGTALVAGIGIMNDNSTMDTVIEKTLPGATWDETMAYHLTDGTTGKKLYDGGTGDTAAIAAAVWDMVLYPDHVTDETAGKYLYEFNSLIQSGDVYVSTSTSSEILMVRDRLGDAGVLITETVIDEEAISNNTTTVFPAERLLYEITGVWLATDPTHALTNYYPGANAAFDSYTGKITLHTPLADDSTEVLINYTFMRGLPDNVIDQFLVEAKLYVKKYTRKDYDWSLGLGATPDEETQIALLAACALAAMRCLEAIATGDILQFGYQFRLGDLSVESMTSGGFHVQAHIDFLKGDVDRKLAMLGRSMYFVARTTRDWGRDAHGYRRQTGGKRSVY